MLTWLAKWGHGTAGHVAGALGRSERGVSERLRRLRAAGYVRSSRPFTSLDTVWTTTAKGLALIGSGLSVPRLATATLIHTLAVADLGIRLSLLSDARVYPEREIAALEPKNVPLLSPALHTPLRGGRHCPDVAVVMPTPEGMRRWALEMELRAKGRREYRLLLASMLVDGAYDYVEYYCADEEIVRRVKGAAADLRVSARVSVDVYRPHVTPLPGLS